MEEDHRLPVQWTLRKWLAVNYDIYKSTELRTLLSEKAGYSLSKTAAAALLKKPPGALRIRTMQAICTALNCKLSDFFDVLPEQQLSPTSATEEKGNGKDARAGKSTQKITKARGSNHRK
jgi:DNA-binding Xre family transcriptional regulator